MSDNPLPSASEVLRIALAARVFTLAALGAGAFTADDGQLGMFAAVAAVACAAQAFSSLPGTSDFRVTVAESFAIAVLASASSSGAVVAMTYLAIPALIAGVLRGVRGVLVVVGVEAAALTLGWVMSPPAADSAAGASPAVWLIISLGLGLLGTSIHRLVGTRTEDRSYQEAVDLLEQLHSLSGRLADGLDASTIADRLLDRARKFVPLDTAALLTPAPDGHWTALRYRGPSAPDALRDVVPQADAARSTVQPWCDGSVLAVPLTRDRNVVAVLVGRGDAVDTTRIDRVNSALAPDVLRLDAALLFAGITASATHEERQRLAREIHDGLAQDLASLGYLLDGVDPGSTGAQARLDGIREEITRVLQEVRHSVFGLRADVSDTRTLGDGVHALAQHLRTHSAIAVHDTVEESPRRLRADVETQLLRIAQEAMNNARKHSGAANLWVRCHVDPPLATVEVIDDGTGLGTPRDDSHGLAIMRERAEQIGARLDIDSRPDSRRGTRVLVRIGGDDEH